MNMWITGAFFLALGGGIWLGTRKFSLGKYCGILLFSALIGLVLVGGGKCGWIPPTLFRDAKAQIDFFKNILFLLFIYAAGYQIGPGIREIMNLKMSIKHVVMAASIFLTGCAIIAGIIAFKVFDRVDYVVGIAAGGLTQTAILGVAEGCLGMKADAGFAANSQIAFMISYFMSTIMTLFICVFVLPRWLFRTTSHSVATELPLRGEVPSVSFKGIPVPPRCGRFFEVEHCGGETLSAVKNRIAPKLSGLTVQGFFRKQKDQLKFYVMSDAEGMGLQSGDTILILGERRNMKMAEQIIGPEKLDMPDDCLNEIKFESQSVQLNRDMTVDELRVQCLSENGYIEQIIDHSGREHNRFSGSLQKGDRVKFYNRSADLKKIAQKIGILIPKTPYTSLICLSFGITIGIALGTLFSWIGVSIMVLLAGIAAGMIRDNWPDKAGFPPQASQLFLDFGMGGFLALSGLSAAGAFFSGDAVLSQIPYFKIIFFSLLIIIMPLMLTALLGLVLYRNHGIQKNERALILPAIAGSRSANPTYENLKTKMNLKNLDKRQTAQIESAFTVAYALANVILSFIGWIIIKVLWQ